MAQKEEGRKMKRKKILPWLMLVATVIMLSACSKTQTNNDFSVGGTVTTDADFFEISILINGEATNYSLDENGKFFIPHLKSGDVVSFSKKGYSFNSFTVGGFSASDVEIVGTKDIYTVMVLCADKNTTIEGAGKYEFGESATIKIKPPKYYETAGIYEKGVKVASSSEYTFSVESDRLFVAEIKKKKYKIVVDKTADECEVIAPDVAEYGEEITVTANDGENYVFSHFEVDGRKFTDKTIKYENLSENPKIVAVFSERLQKSVLTCDGRNVFVTADKRATECDVYIDGKFINTVSPVATLILRDFNLSDGDHIIKIIAKGEGYGEKESEISFSYVRPYDTPKNAGIEIDEDKVFFVFQKSPMAKGYDVFMNNERLDLSKEEVEIAGETVRVRVDTMFIVPGEYVFTVRAIGDRPESLPTPPTKYVYKEALRKPDASIENGILTIVKEDGVVYLVEVNGVNVTDKMQGNTLDIAGSLEEKNKEAIVKVTAKRDGYKSSFVEIIYKAEEKS